MLLSWFGAWCPVVVMFGAFASPERRRTPQRHGGQGRFPLRELAEEGLEGVTLWRCQIMGFGKIGCGSKELCGPMGEPDQFGVATADGGLSLQAPEERALGRRHLALKYWQQIDAIVGAILLRGFLMVAFVFM